MKIIIVVLIVVLICVILYGWIYADEHFTQTNSVDSLTLQEQIKNECQVDTYNLANMMNRLNELMRENNGNMEFLLTDEAHNLINNLSETITKYNTQQIKCVMEKINYNHCSNSANMDISQLNLILALIDKYRPNLKSLYTWLMSNYIKLEEICGNSNKIEKVRDIISKISGIFN
ncbi:hypothetical protein Catovirus_1_989 [Catovirus CTV1]|uniref:Uncharacterized protein n=1 Tax=Catovirus CTV1 TaxID=1977631 RepID=A0A1V0SB65_9VIRU|nr:hypothetical protein Catovirus_1_989 [Catovirus CTV1]